jgi:dCMP deaminase
MRPSKDQYYLNIAKEIAQRSTCFRAKAGSIIVRDDQIVASGYVGAPRKTKDCIERGECLRDKLKIPHGEKYELCRSVHAEMNAIINAARAGVSLLRGTMYLYVQDRDGKSVDSFPCFICKKIIINAGIEKMICSTKEEGKIRIFNIQDWVNDWKQKDLIDDVEKYGFKDPKLV